MKQTTLWHIPYPSFHEDSHVCYSFPSYLGAVSQPWPLEACVNFNSLVGEFWKLKSTQLKMAKVEKHCLGGISENGSRQTHKRITYRLLLTDGKLWLKTNPDIFLLCPLCIYQSRSRPSWWVMTARANERTSFLCPWAFSHLGCFLSHSYQSMLVHLLCEGNLLDSRITFLYFLNL